MMDRCKSCKYNHLNEFTYTSHCEKDSKYFHDEEDSKDCPHYKMNVWIKVGIFCSVLLFVMFIIGDTGGVK